MCVVIPLAMLAACGVKPTHVIEPTLVGVIESIEKEGDLLKPRMTDGSNFTVDLNRDRSLFGHSPNEGDLFLFTEEPAPFLVPERTTAADARGYLSFSDSTSSDHCPFPVNTGGAWEEATSVVFAEGPFRFQKAASFERPPWRESDHYAGETVLCLNQSAEVLGELSHLGRSP